MHFPNSRSDGLGTDIAIFIARRQQLALQASRNSKKTFVSRVAEAWYEQ
jgi:hypothetical protein